MTNRRTLLKSATAAVALSLGAPALAQSDQPIPVVATFSILGDMVERIGGDHVAVTTLIGPDGDGHVYQPTPQDARAVSEAEMLIVNGLEFEGWLDRLVEAAAFDGALVIATTGIVPIAFGDDHDDHEDHGHGDHAFEWAGLFDLKAGTYSWSFAKVDGDYADPAMKMVALSAEGIEDVEESAEEMLESDAAEAKVDGETLTPKGMAYLLEFDVSKDMTVFEVEIAEDGKYAFFTEHMPFEFEASEHFFKDASGADVEPIAQEPDGDHHDHGHDDHAGHDHGVFDPHAWQSLPNGVIYADNITAALAQADPANATAFYQNRAAYVAEMEALDAEIREIVAGLPEDRRIAVTSHDAFQYFARDYGLTFLSPQGVSTESEASAQDVARLIEQMRAEGVSAVFFENIADTRLLERIADETGATIGGTLYPGALSEPDGPAPTYLDMMRHNATTLAQALNS
jgi:zinc/manganese transport system substrate-binding protein